MSSSWGAVIDGTDVDEYENTYLQRASADLIYERSATWVLREQYVVCGEPLSTGGLRETLGSALLVARQSKGKYIGP